jgi:hypothetical protein
MIPKIKIWRVLRVSCIIGHLLFVERTVNCEYRLAMLLTPISALLRLNQHLAASCDYTTRVTSGHLVYTLPS